MQLLKPSDEGLRRAAIILRSGGLVAFPTETVYGLGALASDAAAVHKVFLVKRRPTSSPLTLHVSGFEMASKYASFTNPDSMRLAERYWPGPLTIILPKKGVLPYEVTAGRRALGVRWPAHPVAESLIGMVGDPLVAPSANVSGRPPPLTPTDVIDELDDRIDAVIDGGETPYGIESTVVDLTSKPYRVLRPGLITVEELEQFLGTRFVKSYSMTPSNVERYILSKKIVFLKCSSGADPEKVISWVDMLHRERVLLVALSENAMKYREIGLEVRVLGSRRDPQGVGREIFKLLREVEKTVKEYVVIEPLPEGGLWEAINYRLIKASSQVVEVC